jgi:hypothetical protein
MSMKMVGWVGITLHRRYGRHAVGNGASVAGTAGSLSGCGRAVACHA